MTGWKPEVVSHWVDSGVLVAQRVPNGATQTTRIAIRDLMQFMTSHVVVADIAKAAGSHGRHLNEALRRIGCPVFQVANHRGVPFGSLVSLAELGASLIEAMRRGL